VKPFGTGVAKLLKLIGDSSDIMSLSTFARWQHPLVGRGMRFAVSEYHLLKLYVLASLGCGQYITIGVSWRVFCKHRPADDVQGLLTLRQQQQQQPPPPQQQQLLLLHYYYYYYATTENNIPSIHRWVSLTFRRDVLMYTVFTNYPVSE